MLVGPAPVAEAASCATVGVVSADDFPVTYRRCQGVQNNMLAIAPSSLCGAISQGGEDRGTEHRERFLGCLEKVIRHEVRAINAALMLRLEQQDAMLVATTSISCACPRLCQDLPWASGAQLRCCQTIWTLNMVLMNP
eukprot:SAG31_NODE_2190_length_6229_cov_11.374388_1_plen_138_part_00